MAEPPPCGNNIDLPKQFLERLKQIVPEDQLLSILETFARKPATAGRANPLLTTASALENDMHALGLLATPLPWYSDAYIFPSAQRRTLTKCLPCTDGRLYIQNPSSLLPPLLLKPQAGDRVLDLCAAPGGKTIHLAGMLGNNAKISAVEAVRNRFFRLKANLQKYGAHRVQAYLKDGTHTWRLCPEQFDRVLLDAPCSAEARFNTAIPRTYSLWGVRKIREMQRKQKRLLFSAVQCLKPGGTLLYSTCTFAPEENEAMIYYIVEKFSGALSIEPLVTPCDNVQEGLTRWGAANYPTQMRRARRILPNGIMQAFFLCCLRKHRSTL